MDVALLVARLLLAAVFAVAGLAKLADLRGSRQAVRDFGIPGRLADPFGALLPLAELGIAVALVPKATAWWGAVGALALLLLFVVGIGASMARGKHPDCHCFGQLRSAPAGWATLVRNAVLAAAAGFVVWQGRHDAGRSAVAWLEDLSGGAAVALAAALLGVAAVTTIGWMLVHLLGQNGRLLVRLDEMQARLDGSGVGLGAMAIAEESAAPAEPGLPIGAPAPAFRLVGLHGETQTLDALRAAKKPVLLVFTDPTCDPCNALLPDLGRWQQEHAAVLTVAVLSTGTPDANRAKMTEHGIATVLLEQDREIAELYGANGTPAAVVVLPDGTIGSTLALGGEAIPTLVTRTVRAAVPAPSRVPSRGANGRGAQGGSPAVPVEVALGVPAPALILPDLDGREVSLADFRGAQTLVLFWNPGCGYCQGMLDGLKAWEANRPPGAPQLLVVSAGDAATNRAMGLRSPILLDQDFATGGAFNASGTPSAVLIDPEGRIASPVAVGAPAVFALAGGAVPHPTGSAANRPAMAAPTIGDPSPDFELPDLSGNPLTLASLRGEPTVLLFWNPGCGFCSRMLDDLRALEADPVKGAPRMLFVSTGTVEDNRAMGLRAPIALDTDFGVGQAFGASGTPSAVLVDANGRIASSLAEGGPDVLALVAAPPRTTAQRFRRLASLLRP